jgi:hypothetical protein
LLLQLTIAMHLSNHLEETNQQALSHEPNVLLQLKEEVMRVQNSGQKTRR